MSGHSGDSMPVIVHWYVFRNDCYWEIIKTKYLHVSRLHLLPFDGYASWWLYYFTKLTGHNNIRGWYNEKGKLCSPMYMLVHDDVKETGIQTYPWHVRLWWLRWLRRTRYENCSTGHWQCVSLMAADILVSNIDLVSLWFLL